MKVLLVKSLAWICSLVPARLAHAFATPIAALLWLTASRLRRVSLANLAACFPRRTEAERRALARAALVHYVRAVFETGMSWFWPLERMQALFLPTQGEEHLAAALATGRGVILLSPHIGAWELITVTHAHLFTGAVLYKPGDDPALNAAMLEKRQRIYVPLVPANQRGLRQVLSSLKEGKAIGALPDQEPRDGEGVFAPFFGVPALTGVMVPRLAAKVDAPVVFGACLREGRGRYRMHFLPVGEAIRSPDLEAAAAELNRGVERCIALAPEQYLWAYKRFRARPPGAPPVY